MYKAKCIKDVKWGDTNHIIIHKGSILEYEFDPNNEYPYIVKPIRLTQEGWKEYFKIVLVIPEFIEKEEMQI